MSVDLSDSPSDVLMTQTHRADPEDPAVAGHEASAAEILAHIVDQSRERIAAIDTNFRFTYLSRAYREAFERWYGVAVGPGEDVRSALEAWPDQCELAIGYWRRALAGEAFTVVIPTGGAPASRTFFEMAFSPLRSADGRIEGAFQVVRDTTAHERKQEEIDWRHIEAELRESRDLLRAVLDATADAVFVKDLAGRYVLMNPAGARMVGRSIEETIGKDDFAIFEQATAEQAIARDREVLETGEPLTTEQTGTAAGVTRHFLTTKSPLRDKHGEIIGLVGVARDITESVRAQLELRRKGELLERIIDAIPVMIVIYDPALHEFRVNREFERRLGWTNHEFAGQDLMALCYPDPEYREEVRRFMQSLEEGWRDFRVTTRWGAELESSWANIRLSDDTRIGIGIDVREQRRTERGLRFLADASSVLADSLDYEETLRHVAELAVPEIADWCAVDLLEENGELRRVAMAHADPERRRLSDEFVRLFPQRLDSLVGVGVVIRTGRSILLPSIPEWVYEKSASDPERLELLRAFGLHSILIVPLEVGGHRFGAITFLQAESGRTFTEADLPLAEELARRAAGAIQNARAYRAEQYARAAAERASEAKDQFLAIMSHELRTPLTAVLGYADLLTSGVSGELNERQRDYVGRIQQGALHLISIIEEILIFARAEAGKEEIRLATVDAAAIARDVATMIEAEAASKGLAIRTRGLDDRIALDTDGGKLRQILVNLLGNAVKFTDQGEVMLELVSAPEHLLFHVRDTGCGIPEEMHELIFEPFTQLDSSMTREKGGTGLGLTIARRLAALLGGTVSVDSQPGVGSTFTLRLPLVGPGREA